MLFRVALTLSGLLISLNISAFIPGEEEIIKAWKLDDFYSVKHEVQIDTLIDGFHLHNPLYLKSISNSFLGNPGLASKSNIYADREDESRFIFINPFQSYLNKPSETWYYNTRRPFTLINFSTGGPRQKNEKMLEILHTQNVSPDFNVGFKYFNINSEGQYSFQNAVTNSITLFSNYELPDYQAYFNLNLNSVRVFENGGLADDNLLGQPELSTEDIEVRLHDVRNGLRHNGLFLSHAWQPFFSPVQEITSTGMRSWLSGLNLFHILKYDQYKRTYQDGNPLSGFYPEVLIDETGTSDSLYYRRLENILMVQLPEFKKGIVSFEARAGISNEFLRRDFNIIPDTTFALSNSIDTLVRYRDGANYSTTSFMAIANGRAGEVFGIWGKADFHFQGYRAGDYDVEAGTAFNFFEGKNAAVIEADFRQREYTPSVFMNSFSSNHFKWDNDFNKISESSLTGSFSMPGRNFKVKASFNLLNNFIYFDNSAIPVQHEEIIPVATFSIRKDFHLWKFSLHNIIEYQIIQDNTVLPLPELSAYHSTRFNQSIIPDMLNMQIGLDIYYSTGHYGYAYQPATSQFYLQNERMLGNYPYIDLFINFKHKRTRVFLKVEHLNTGWTKPDYFSVLNYPRNERMFKLGVSWSFYN